MPLDPNRQFALLVGLNTYPSSRNLKGPMNDVDLFKQWLQTDLGLPDDNIKIWTDKPKKFREPKVTDFYEWLMDWEDLANAAPGGRPKWDRLYVLLAGHGYNAVTGQQSLILPMTTATYWDTVPAIPFRESLRLRALFREIIVVFDACRDVLDIAPDSPWGDHAQAAPESQDVRVFSYFASKNGKKAKEVDFGATGWGGVLTRAFLAGMKGYAADDQGAIYADKLRGYLYAAVKDKLGKDVEPDIPDEGDPNDPPVLLLHTTQRLPQVKFQSRSGAGKVKLERTGFTTLTLDLSNGPQVASLPFGYYTMTKPDGSQEKLIAAWEEKHVTV